MVFKFTQKNSIKKSIKERKKDEDKEKKNL